MRLETSVDLTIIEINNQRGKDLLYFGSISFNGFVYLIIGIPDVKDSLLRIRLNLSLVRLVTLKSYIN